MVRSLSTYRIQGCGALIRARWQAPLGPLRCPTTDQLRSTRSKIEVDRKRLIQGLLRLHSRYGPPDRSAAQGNLCHEAPALAVTRTSRSSATVPKTDLRSAANTGSSQIARRRAEQFVWNMTRLLLLVKIQLACLPVTKPRVTFAQ